MDKMEWALWGLEYLRKARRAIHNDFNDAMNEVRDYQGAHRESWYGSCKSIIPNLYHFSMEFVADTQIPSERFASPDVFETELTSYRAWVQEMADELDREDQKYQTNNKLDGPPFLVTVARRRVTTMMDTIDYVQSKKPYVPAVNPVEADIDLVLGLARRFHESVLSLKYHPHRGTVFAVKNEWDCQYLFRAILAAHIDDVRDEEWNPSVGGSSTRCEFFLKTLCAMVELKYVRKANPPVAFHAFRTTDLVLMAKAEDCTNAYEPSLQLRDIVSLNNGGPQAMVVDVDDAGAGF